MNEQKTVSKVEAQRSADNALFEEEQQKKIDEKKANADKSNQESVVVGNEVTNKILGKYGVTNTVTQDELEKREEDSTEEGKPAEEEKPAVNTIEQATSETNEEFVDITEADLNALEEAGIPETDLEGKTAEEVKKMASDLLKKQDDTTASQEPEKIIISDAYAEQLALTYPFAKNLKGKTMEEVMDIIQNQNQYISGLEQQKGKQDKVDDPDNSQKTETNDEVTAEDVTALLDPTRPAEDVAKDLNALLKKGRQGDLNKAVEEKIKELLPNLDGLQTQNVEAQKKQFLGDLSKQLPDAIDAEKVFQDWKVKTKTTLSKQAKMALVQNPDLMIQTIANDYNLTNTSTEKNELEKTKNQTIKKQTYANLRKLLKSNSKLGSGAKFNFTRNKVNDTDLGSEEGDPSEVMAGKILSKYLNR